MSPINLFAFPIKIVIHTTRRVYKRHDNGVVPIYPITSKSCSNCAVQSYKSYSDGAHTEDVSPCLICICIYLLELVNFFIAPKRLIRVSTGVIFYLSAFFSLHFMEWWNSRNDFLIAVSANTIYVRIGSIRCKTLKRLCWAFWKGDIRCNVYKMMTLS